MMFADSMMPVEVDNKFCANCIMHTWKQPKDKSSLKHCPGCRMILYCGEACRKEHWRKVHKKHCQFLADPTRCPESQHDAETCALCRAAAGTGKGKRRMGGRGQQRKQSSSSYECFIKDMHFSPSLASPHPFPVAGVRDDLLEMSIIVIQKLLHKLKENPRVALVCSDELEVMEEFMWNNRRSIWRQRKVFSHPKISCLNIQACRPRDQVMSISKKVMQGKAGKDASELWKITELVYAFMRIIGTYEQQDALKDPIDSMPEQFRDLVKLALDNKFEFLDTAEDIIDSLSTKVIPYEDIVMKLCGGKKRQNCSFCGVKIKVTEYVDVSIFEESSAVLFDPVSVRMFRCGSEDCRTKASSRKNDMIKFTLAVATAVNERQTSCCDFCFQLSPIERVHRCCNCLTVMYCSKSCHKTDKEKHSEKYCIEEERKTKEDRSIRRQIGKITERRVASFTGGSFYEENEALVSEAIEAFRFEDSKKQGGPNISEVD